ncbi:isoprenylcysteine carboxylmethyltransferase family protein [Colwelliaceae bacterium 6441]
MIQLKLKVPPLLLVLIVATLMWLSHQLFPIVLIAEHIAIAFFVFFVVLGGLVITYGAFTFRKAQTTVNPTKPEATSSLVKVGVYAITRNPMYVGMVSCLIGWGLYLSNPSALLFIFAFIFYINRFQIAPEEQVLTTIFGNEYIDYCASVRRWL